MRRAKGGHYQDRFFLVPRPVVLDQALVYNPPSCVQGRITGQPCVYLALAAQASDFLRCFGYFLVILAMFFVLFVSPTPLRALLRLRMSLEGMNRKDNR
jgi:hypothetical protein